MPGLVHISFFPASVRGPMSYSLYLHLNPALKTRTTNSVISFLTVSLTSSTSCPRVVAHLSASEGNARICLRMQVELWSTER